MKEPSIELIKALKALKDEIPADQFNNVLNGLGVDSKSFEDRIKGLEREYEFIGDLYICNVCKDIIPIDEEFTTNIGEKSCDAIITLKNDKKIMVEIKSTSKDEYSISSGNFNSRVEWARKNGYELYFAINLFNYWALYSADQLIQWNRKITLNNFPESLLSEVFNIVYFMSTNKIKFISTYSSNSSHENLGIKDIETDSYLIKEEFYVNDELVKEVTTTDNNGLPLVLLSAEIRLRCSRKNLKINDFSTKTIYELDSNNSFCSLDIIKTTISEMSGTSLKNKYNSFLKMISKKDNRDKINIWLNELVKLLRMTPYILMPASKSKEND